MDYLSDIVVTIWAKELWIWSDFGPFHRLAHTVFCLGTSAYGNVIRNAYAASRILL